MRRLWIPLALLVLGLGSSPAARADAVGHVNFFLGEKAMDSDDWDPVDQQGEFGAIMSFGKSDWPVFIAVDVLTSGQEKDVFGDILPGPAKLKGGTFEAAFGARKIWNVGSTGITHPYVGGGIAAIGAAAKVEAGIISVDAGDAAIGPWVDGGLFWRLGSHFNLGFDLRWSNAKVDLDFGQGIVASDIQAGGFHGGITLGFGW